ncbi:hypothetical protein BJ684DRAFT_19526 [Piptocephalis cylindrospora]|uniref:C2 domain-containing protein n=1 Tax=Piptocephalis cylindrospora TaxID=1907219 RepID=A0A4P9Y5N4_9FUNG|nr:hypothetical protein BJ684DRAFT_19526 [Piptocephalis cylindrospora]|eukprot:RKP14032.1 hypothetical protein BJ684DRAFT_19526 [Piptocephalis cylindrospora]
MPFLEEVPWSKKMIQYGMDIQLAHDSILLRTLNNLGTIYKKSCDAVFWPGMSSVFVGAVHKWFNPLDLLDLLCNSSGYDHTLLLDLGSSLHYGLDDHSSLWAFIDTIANLANDPARLPTLLDADLTNQPANQHFGKMSNPEARRSLPQPPSQLDPFQVYLLALRCLVLASKEKVARQTRGPALSPPSSTSPTGTSSPNTYTPAGSSITKPGPTSMSSSPSASANSVGSVTSTPPITTPSNRPLSSVGLFSLGKSPLFPSLTGGSKDRLPKEFYRSLRRRLEAIRLPSNTARLPNGCREPEVVQSVAGFGVGVMRDKKFKERAKSPGTMSDLVAAFLEATVLSGVRAPGAQAPYIHAFVHVTRECLMVEFPGQSFFPTAMQDLKGVEEIMKGRAGRPRSVTSASSEGSAISPYSRTRPAPPKHSQSFVDSDGLCERLRQVMNIPEALHREAMDEIGRRNSEQKAMQDIKMCLVAVSQDRHPFLTPRDFSSDEEYQAWKAKERSMLEQLLLGMNQCSPEVMHRSSMDDVAPSTPNETEYEYIPRDPRAAFALLTRLFIQSDFTGEAPKDLGEESSSEEEEEEEEEGGRRRREVGLGEERRGPGGKGSSRGGKVRPEWILKSSLQILRECGTRWRMGQTYRFITILDGIKVACEQGLVPIESVERALAYLEKSKKSMDSGEWFSGDRKYILRAFTEVNRLTIRYMAQILLDFDRKSEKDIGIYLCILDDVHSDEFFQTYSTDLASSIEEVVCAIQAAATKRYNRVYEQTNEICPDGSRPDEIMQMLTTTEAIMMETKETGKRYPSLILGEVDVAGVALSTYLKYYVLEMENLTQSPVMARAAETEGRAGEVVFQLYRGARLIQRMHRRSGLNLDVSFDLSRWFYPHVVRWIRLTEGLSLEWVSSAVRMDQFVPVSLESKSSSSVIDLLTAIRQQVSFLEGLNWPDEVHAAHFTTQLSRVINKAVEQYCSVMEMLFRQEIYGFTIPLDAPKQESKTKGAADREAPKSWFERARDAALRPKKVAEAVHFRAETCVKLNNIEATQKHLDDLYEELEVDRVAEVLAEAKGQDHTPGQEGSSIMGSPLSGAGSVTSMSGLSIPGITPVSRMGMHIYSIKVVLGEELMACDRNGLSDPYVVLTFGEGEEIGRTRVIYETCNPRFDETFEVRFRSPVTLTLTVYDRDAIGSDDVCGQGTFHLQPSLLDDYMSHEMWVELDTQGRILLRVSMEGEREDVRFYFGKTFRTLRRTQADMARMIIEQMSGYLRHCLSKKILFRVLYAQDKISYFGTKSQGDGGKQHATEKECDDALESLYDYLDRNMSTLHQHLREDVAMMVLSKLWKEILRTMEDHMAPPLSDQPSGQRPLDAYALQMILTCIELLKVYFHGGDEGDGVSIDILETGRYPIIQELGRLYLMSTDELLLEYGRAAGAAEEEAFAKGRRVLRNKSVAHRRNLGTIRDRNGQKRKAKVDVAACALRILRMHPGSHQFVAEQVQQRAGPTETKMSRKDLPAVPSLSARVEKADVEGKNPVKEAGAGLGRLRLG